MRDCDPVEQEARQTQLDQWYKDAGREDKEHPMYGLYTGLADMAREGEL